MRIRVAECGVGTKGEEFYPGGYSYWNVSKDGSVVKEPTAEEQAKTIAKTVIESAFNGKAKKCPHCVGNTCQWYGAGVCLGGMDKKPKQTPAS